MLEASAGTGKTYTIAALAARYVADGTPLERLLLVTFTRMATGELRERVRERLVSVERGLARRWPAPPPRTDPVVALLARRPPTRPARHDRLARAVADFDAATIATTHGFCQEVLGGLGVAGDLEPDVDFVEDLSDLVDEVVDDLYVRRFPPATRRPAAFGRAEAGADRPGGDRQPGAPDRLRRRRASPQMRLRLAEAVRDEFEARKRAADGDDLRRPADAARAALGGPGGAAVAAAAARAATRSVLVDEFQDTDPAQWEIMRRAFGDGRRHAGADRRPQAGDLRLPRRRRLRLPRGRREAAGTRATLGVNWRSDQGLIDAHDALFAGVKLGHEGSPTGTCGAAAAHQAPRLHGAPVAAPLRIRVVLRDEPCSQLTATATRANAGAASTSPATSPPTSSRCCRRGAEIERRTGTGDGDRREPSARPRRRAGAHQPARRA